VRVHASGTGKTIEEALAKPLAELATAALHAHEFDKLHDKLKITDGKAVVDAEKARVANPHRKQLEVTLRAFIGMVAPVEGHKYRVLVSYSDDGADSHSRVEVDLALE